MLEEKIVRSIEDQCGLDRAIDPMQDALDRAFDRAPALHDALHGTWLGHPLHAALTDIPVGAFTATFALDMFESFGGEKRLRRSADITLMVGLVGAMGAAVAGLVDWTHTDGGAKRIGFIHGITNAVIGGLYGASLFARKQKNRKLGITLSSMGYCLLLFSSWLGGEMTYRHGVGVRRDALKRRERELPRALRGEEREGSGERETHEARTT